MLYNSTKLYGGFLKFHPISPSNQRAWGCPNLDGTDLKTLQEPLDHFVIPKLGHKAEALCSGLPETGQLQQKETML
jgi:hypothetical protein